MKIFPIDASEKVMSFDILGVIFEDEVSISSVAGGSA
jgi:hypothetical protein